MKYAVEDFLNHQGSNHFSLSETKQSRYDNDDFENAWNQLQLNTRWWRFKNRFTVSPSVADVTQEMPRKSFFHFHTAALHVDKSRQCSGTLNRWWLLSSYQPHTSNTNPASRKVTTARGQESVKRSAAEVPCGAPGRKIPPRVRI